jgi:hypothetical protein
MNRKDWVGNNKSVYSTLGASNHSLENREINDFYATDPEAIVHLLGLEKFSNKIWEPACGKGHLSHFMELKGYEVRSTDLIDRGYGQGGIDFLAVNEPWNGDIITNPPYILASEFIIKAMQLIPNGNKIAMFLKLQFLEGKERKKLFKQYPPKVVYVSSSRINCAKNGEFEKSSSSAIAYGWFLWEKGFTGEPVIRWFN